MTATHTIHLISSDPAFSGPYALRAQRALAHIQHLCDIDEITLSGKNRLLKWLFHENTQHLCRRIDFSAKEIRILLLGYVQHDGIGDYFHMLHAAHLIQRAIPHAKIAIGAETHALCERKDKFPPSPFLTFLWGVSLKSDGRFIYENPSKDQRTQETCAEIAKTATIILDLPHCNYGNSIDFLDDAIPSSRLIEYGNFGDNPIRPLKQYGSFHGMGVHPMESGLIWKEPQPQETALESLEDTFLRNSLSHPSTHDYAQTHILHFSYFGEQRTEIFIKLCLEYDKSDERPFIDIIIPQQLQTKDIQCIIDLCAVRRIKHLEILQKGKVPTYFPFPNAGKTVRLIHPFPLPSEDIQNLIALASGCVGCTGDLSLSEVLSNGKIPLYDSPAHKSAFVDSLKQLAKEYAKSPDSLLVKYIEKFNVFRYTDQEIEERAQLLRNPMLASEMKEFIAFLKVHFNFNEVLINIVSRNLALAFHPQLYSSEEKLIAAFQSGEITLAEAAHAYEQLIDSIALE